MTSEEGNGHSAGDRTPTRLSCFVTMMALTFCSILGSMLAYFTHPWWFKGGGSFAVIYDFIGGIVLGGFLGLVAGLLIVAVMSRLQWPPNEKT